MTLHKVRKFNSECDSAETLLQKGVSAKPCRVGGEERTCAYVGHIMLPSVSDNDYDAIVGGTEWLRGQYYSLRSSG